MNLLFTLIAFITFANSQSGRGGLQIKLDETSYKAELKEGFHFNKEAPNKITIDGAPLAVKKLDGRIAVFGPIPKVWQEGKASLYVCDDAVTFCEPNFIQLKGTAKSADGVGITRSPEFGKINSHGFIEEDLEQAISEAKKQNKLVLIDFSARWCPGCVRYENETFPTQEFSNLTKKYIKIKIDVDRFENQVLSKKFNVSGIPTLLVINAEQEEIDRLVDYQPLSILSPFLTSIAENPLTIAELKKKSDKISREITAKRLVGSGKFEESLKYFSKNSTAPEYLYAKVKLAAKKFKEDNKYKSAYIKTLKQAIQQEPSSSRSISWRTDLVGLLDSAPEIEAIKTEGVNAATNALQSRDSTLAALKSDLIGEYTDYEDFLLAIKRAELVEASKAPKEEVLKNWNAAAQIGKAHKIKAKRFGPALRLLIVLMKAEQYAEADTLSLALLKEQPGHGDLQRRRLRILVEQKKFKDAVKLGQTALKNSYGRNEFWVVEVLAKALIANQQQNEAKTLIDSYLNKSDMDWSNLSSTKKTLEDLRTQLH